MTGCRFGQISGIGGTTEEERVRGRMRAWWERCRPRGDRGDVPGWVMVTLMTAGLVLSIWALAGPKLEEVFTTAVSQVLGGP